MIALVDCNNFFASCERLFRADLQNVPIAVLSSNDGCIVARSNEVKRLGIPMGVPYFKVRDVIQRNNVVCFSSNFSLYSNISQRILEVLSRAAPEIEIYSIDEAFLDLTTLAIADHQLWAQSLRQTVQKEVGMPVSVGVAPTKTLAKLASSYAKKHNQACLLEPGNAQYKEVLSQTVPGDIWGIGRRLAPKLERVGIHSALHFVEASTKWVRSQMGINGVRTQSELAGTPVYPFDAQKAPQKSLMVSRSFGHTIQNSNELETAVASFASKAAFTLRRHQQVTQSIGLYLRRTKSIDGVHGGQTARKNFTTATNDTGELVSAALSLLYEMYDPACGYKKAGIFSSSLSSANICQVDLFDTRSPQARSKRKDFMRAIDAVNHRYGAETVHSAAINPSATQWHTKKQKMSPAYTTDWNQLPKLYAGKL